MCDHLSIFSYLKPLMLLLTWLPAIPWCPVMSLYMNPIFWLRSIDSWGYEIVLNEIPSLSSLTSQDMSAKYCTCNCIHHLLCCCSRLWLCFGSFVFPWLCPSCPAAMSTASSHAILSLVCSDFQLPGSSTDLQTHCQSCGRFCRSSH